MTGPLLTELRAALARFRRSYGYVIGATMSLAIGISLATAVFAVVHAVMGRPLGVADADRLGVYTQVHRTTRQQYGGMGGSNMYVAMREQASAFTDIAAYHTQNTVLGEEDDRVFVSGVAVTRNMFDLLGVRPVLGRGFTLEDEGQNVAVLSHATWTARFAADSGIVGKEIVASGEGAKRIRVLGVMPPTMEFPVQNRIWFLLPDSLLQNEGRGREFAGWSEVIGRLKPGVSFAQASAQVNAIFRGLTQHDELRSQRDAKMITLRADLLASITRPLSLWVAAAILVLLLCAVNFATMSLSRGMRRRGELAVRAALGASRGQLIRVLMLEAMLLSALGGAIAALLGWWLISFANVWFYAGAMPAQPVMDFTTVLFAIAAAMVVGFIFAAAPAVELAKIDLRGMLQGDSSSTTSKRGELFGRRALVALQLSMALTAVACVTALTQADRRFRNFDTAYDYEQLAYASVGSRESGKRFDMNPIIEASRSAPGVEAATATGHVATAIVWDPGGTVVDWPRAYVARIAPNLFDVIGVKLLAGRIPTTDEIASGDAILVSESMARRLVGVPERAAGLRLRMKFGRGTHRDWHTITGVVPDLGGGWVLGLDWTMYLVEDPRSWRAGQIVMRVSGDSRDRIKPIQAALRSALGANTYAYVGASKVAMAKAKATNRGRNIFLAVVTGLALVLAVVGVYGLTSYSTELRLREFGIRIALGASTPRLAGTVLADLWWMSAIGIGVGFYAAFRLTEFLDTIYRNPMMTRPLITMPIVPTAVAAGTLVVIAIIGTSVPLRRVLRLDVMRTVSGSSR